MRGSFEIGGKAVAAGARDLVTLHVSKLSNHTPVTLPVHVLHGLRPGPVMFISAAVHGDELNGVEIIRRVLNTLRPADIGGTLLAIPVVNAFGFIGRSRYLPDRRDLNRAFPGSATGSLASRLAHIFLEQIVRRCRYGIDIHTAAVHRTNLPQIRADFVRRPSSRPLAEAFGSHVVLASPERPGSLRHSACAAGVDVLVYEGGEGLRFDEAAIDAGVAGIANVMRHTGMLELPDGIESTPNEPRKPVFAHSSKWVRAPDGGVFRAVKEIGSVIREGERVGWISNPYDDTQTEIVSPRRGIIVGGTTLPIVNMGDALFHIAWSDEVGQQRRKPARAPVAAPLEAPDAALLPDIQPETVMDEDEII